MFSLIFTGFLLIGLGIWQLQTPLDVLWQRQERYLLARGLSPQRNEVWERNVRWRGSVVLGLGGLMLLMAFMFAMSTPPKMSGVSINGRELTQQEWDACHHDAATCLTMEANQGRI